MPPSPEIHTTLLGFGNQEVLRLNMEVVQDGLTDIEEQTYRYEQLVQDVIPVGGPRYGRLMAVHLTVHTLSTVHHAVHRELLSTLFLSVDAAMAGWEGAEMDEYNRARRDAR